MLVSLLFGIPGLSWDSPIQHFEAFSGEAEVTKAEWRVVRMTFRQVFTFSPILQLYREPPVKPNPFEGFKNQVVVVGMNLRQRFLLGGSQSNCFINVYLLVKKVWPSFPWGQKFVELLPPIKAERSAVPFDIRLDPTNMNLLSNEGFANALFFACNLSPGSGHVSAPVCSTWVFMTHSWMINQVFFLG